MKVKEVISDRDKKLFIQFPISLYKEDKHWIRPLDKDIEAVFDPKKNKAFRSGEIIRWLLLDDVGKIIGRVAAFVDRKNAIKGNLQPTGGIGFFECIRNKEAAFILFDHCKDWLKSKGMEAMDGPINFGSKDRWWGLLVDGFDRDPNYQCNYNFPYYIEFFESYGFQTYFKQLTFGRTVVGPISPKIKYKADLISQDPDFMCRHLRKDEIGKLATYIRIVYNKAWANRAESPEISQQQAEIIVKQMKPILDVHLLFFGFYKNEPISFFLSLPEINQIFKHVNGKLNLLGKIIFAWHQLRKTNRKAFGILFGVVPEFQAQGVDGAMILESRKVLQDEYKRYDEYEMNWIGDFNPKMINVVTQVDSALIKTHITYRLLFDPNKPFKRHPILN